jgi:LmbE family N-acetylglucosaminyl deacetylase
MHSSPSRGPLLAALLLMSFLPLRAQMQAPVPPPDPRYKADLLLIVAHPDDDTGVSTFLSKAVYDDHKRVAVIFTNRGGSGPDAVSMAQGKALADEREMEGRRSLAARGITNVWFLDGRDTPTQDVLHSLETMDHGQLLEEVVRLVRLTRPEAILSWMPAYVAGENHGDHQASSVLAVEAFSMAGNPTIFPEQVTAPRWYRGIGMYGEGLHPWQPQKLYFFSDASHPDFLKGHGPAYLASDVSPSKHVTYAELNREAWKAYATQLDFGQSTLDYFVNQPEYLVLGKSLVPAPVTGGVFAGVTNKPIAYVAPPGYHPVARTGITVALGGPWAFYRQFYRAYGLQSMEGLVKPLQTALSSDNQLWVPLLLRNNTNAAEDITVHADLPAGWTGETADRIYPVPPGGEYPAQLFYTAPSGQGLKSPQSLAWTAVVNGKPVGQVHLSVYLEMDGVPQ